MSRGARLPGSCATCLSASSLASPWAPLPLAAGGLAAALPGGAHGAASGPLPAAREGKSSAAGGPRPGSTEIREQGIEAPRTLKVLDTMQAPEVVGTDPGGKAVGAFWRAIWHQARHGRAEFLMSEGERWGSLTRLIELTDSVICRRLISVSSLQRGKGWLCAQASPFFPSLNGS